MFQSPTSGVGLEARVQRFFLAQGIFAERHLFPAASPDHRMLATDIDVLVSEYVSGFNTTRRHIECKGGKIQLLDRILWLSGVRALLKADGSYLLINSFDKDASDFANNLNIQLFTLKQLDNWETSIHIPLDVWPCRSDFQMYDVAKARWMKANEGKAEDTSWRVLREVLGFIEIDSWLIFRYSNLNRLIRYLQTIGKMYEKSSDGHFKLFSKYLVSALLVRLCQYLLAVCRDVSRLPTTNVADYLSQRLTYGDQEPERASGLIEGTLDWVKRALEKRSIALPPEIDFGRFYEPPPYSKEFIELINRLLQQSNESKYLTITMEASQFSTEEIIKKLPRLKSATNADGSLAALVKGFTIRAFSIPKELTDCLANDLKGKYTLKASGIKRRPGHGQAELPLK